MPQVKSMRCKVEIIFRQPIAVVSNGKVHEGVISRTHITDYRPEFTKEKPYLVEVFPVDSDDEFYYLADNIAIVQVSIIDEIDD